MRAIATIASPALSGGSRPERRAHDRTNPAPTPTGRMLVAVASEGAHAVSRPNSRPSAAFLAHLIATAQHAPQTRRLRRAEPEQAVAVYLAAASAVYDGRSYFDAIWNQ